MIGGTLVILAAGVGRRFGGTKQIAKVGPHGETLIDYTVFDAIRAGCSRVVFVIRREIEGEFRSAVGDRISGQIDVAYAYQDMDLAALGLSSTIVRSRPWGTGHAVLVAAAQVTTPFAVANADDFYGRKAYASIYESLHTEFGGPIPMYSMAGYRLSDTLPAIGAVSRGICETNADGRLSRIVEVSGIERDGEGGAYSDNFGRHLLPGEARVSMNLWGFTLTIFAQLRERFAAFVKTDDGEREFYLPAAVGELIAAGTAHVRVFSAGGRWCGVTRSEDRESVAATLAELTRAGEYLSPLWGKT